MDRVRHNRRDSSNDEIVVTVITKKQQDLEQIMRKGIRFQLLHNVSSVKVLVKRALGGRILSWLRNLGTWFSKTNSELFRAAENEVMIARKVVKVDNGRKTQGEEPK